VECFAVRVCTLASDHEQLVRSAFAAYLRGDLQALLALVDGDFEWTYLDPSDPDPLPQVCHGHRELARALRRRATRGLRGALDEVTGHGDRLLVGVRTPGIERYRAWGTGDVDYFVVTVRGRRIQALRACRDRREAVALAGAD
jgi:ketosteroid isomerase-like protein